MTRELWRALCRLTDADLQIEQALRVAGDQPSISRLVLEEIRDDIAFARRMIRSNGYAK
jgi:hypothetical protein